MRTLAALFCTATLMVCGAVPALAIDFQAKGEWIMSFDYGTGGNFMSKDRTGNRFAGNQRATSHAGEDNFEARQRIRLQLDAVASESLSGTVYFEIGDSVWGQSESVFGGGGALGADGKIVELKRAYIDWTIPGAGIQTRMGLQGFYLPSYTFGSAILMEDGAGITLSYKFNDTATLTAFWLRPYNDNWTGKNATGLYAHDPANLFDNMDLFSLVLPLSFDGMKVTPWIMGGAMGRNTFRGLSFADVKNGSFNGANPVDTRMNLAPLIGDGHGLAADGFTRTRKFNTYTSLFWAGLTGEVTAASPWRFAWDFNYGMTDTGVEAYNRRGALLTALAEYKMDWGTPGIVAWWSSGDDGNLSNGSELMPSISIGSGGYTLSTLGTWGEPWLSNDGITGRSAVGTWGVGARIMDMSFVDKLSHNLRINYFQGTNDPSMAGYITGTRTYRGMPARGVISDFSNADGVYLTTQDSGLEVNVDTHYQIYENLDMWVHLGYIHLMLDDSWSMWGGKAGIAGNSLNLTDAFRANVAFRYSF